MYCACAKINCIMLLGVQVSIAGRIYEAVERAKELGCNTMQIFSRNPRQWRHGELEKEEIIEFRKRREKAKISPLFIHIPYTLNLASPDAALYHKSIEVYIKDIKEAGLLGADYLVTHLGSHMKKGENWGLGRFVNALNIILDKTPSEVEILLENTSGSGSWLGYKFQHHKIILDKIHKPQRVGICLDTCHAYTAGYDIASEKGLNNMLEEMDNLVGLEKLKLVHLNDAKDTLGSRRDRHAHIGEGIIGKEAFKRIVHHPQLKDLPFILETPKRIAEDDRRNLEVVRNL
ncbi:MAG: deoxyribonuclease IV [Candidatus Omnitrophica bacterium]|nr:deoxyribonuclease IV [Candidatus Omnitrophota bacterium]